MRARQQLQRMALVAAVVGALASGCVASDGDSTFTVVNESDFVVDALYITESSSLGWGPDVLAGQGLFPDEEIIIEDLDCDFYDVRLIDELGAECLLFDFDLCFDDAVWFITNAELAACDSAF